MGYDTDQIPANNTAQMIGKAWAFHRNSQHDEAINLFQDIIRQNPDDVDAHYGLGLAQRAVGQTDSAAQTFQAAYDKATARLSELREEAAQGDTHIANNLQTTEDDRYMMLTRMLHQRLKEHGIDVPAVLEVF
jgi:lipopolysaccharide biosynthesis regulator YciM